MNKRGDQEAVGHDRPHLRPSRRVPDHAVRADRILASPVAVEAPDNVISILYNARKRSVSFRCRHFMDEGFRWIFKTGTPYLFQMALRAATQILKFISRTRHSDYSHSSLRERRFILTRDWNGIAFHLLMPCVLYATHANVHDMTKTWVWKKCALIGKLRPKL